jgi:hypothetical protein
MGKRTTLALLSAVAAIATFGVGTANAAPAVTGGATSITQTSARFYGVVNSTGVETVWAFQYGTTVGYGRMTKSTVIANPQNGTVVSALVSSLNPGTTYHFRLVVLQGSYPTTATAGADQTFRTSGSTLSGKPPKPPFHIGKGSLRSHRVRVRSGYALIPLSCTGVRGSLCAGKITLTGSAKRGKRVTNVSCGSSTFLLSSAATKSVNVFIGQRCQSLLRATRSRSLLGKLSAAFAGTQGKLKSSITLLG